MENNIFHFFNIILKLRNIAKNRKINEIIPIEFKNLDIQKIQNNKKTLFVCSHDYCFTDILSIYLLGIKTNLLKNTYVIARKGFEYLIPGVKFIDRKNTTENMINILNNNQNVIVFYSRIHIENLNIDKIISKSSINIIPIRISSDTLKPLSHNIDGALENIDFYLHNKFKIEIFDKIDYDKSFKKKDFVESLKKILYPDNGYFDKNNFFITKIKDKEENEEKINDNKIINI